MLQSGVEILAADRVFHSRVDALSLGRLVFHILNLLVYVLHRKADFDVLVSLPDN